MSWKKKAVITALLLGIPLGILTFSGRPQQTLGFAAPQISPGGGATIGEFRSGNKDVGAVAGDLISSPGVSIGERIGRTLFGGSSDSRIQEEARRQAERSSQMFSPSHQPSTVQGRSPLPPSYDNAITADDRSRREAAQNSGVNSIPTVTIAPGLPQAPSPQAYVKVLPGLPAPTPPSGDRFSQPEANPVLRVSEKPVSTFSVDVDTASYSYVRKAISEGRLPQVEAVRLEEMINYFKYDYDLPGQSGAPFTVAAAVAPSPFADGRKLMRIGIKGRVIPQEVRPPLNLVLLVDVSGSMSPSDRLPLLKRGLVLLAESLQPTDRVSIVTYAGYAGVALPPTTGDRKTEIINAVNSLGAGGGTAGSEGIRQAYSLAEANYDPKAANRVILATDGDFNVGITNPAELESYVAGKRSSGVFLTVLGFGQGNLNDSLMQRLAQKGNGVAAYIDSIAEARRVLVDDAGASLHTIAKDMKVQVEFNPQKVAEYRLIGYETRMLAREEFNDDRVDAGDIGEGHTVTALYEITPVGGPVTVDELRYGKSPSQEPEASGEAAGAASGEYAFVKVRWKEPKSETSELLSVPVDPSVETASLDKADESFRFAAAVAGFGEILKGKGNAGSMTLSRVEELAQGARGKDTDLTRAEFVRLVKDAGELLARAQPRPQPPMLSYPTQLPPLPCAPGVSGCPN